MHPGCKKAIPTASHRSLCEGGCVRCSCYRCPRFIPVESSRQFTEQLTAFSFSAFMISDTDHGLIDSHGIAFEWIAVCFQEHNRSGRSCAFVSIQKRLSLGNVIAIGCCNIKDISLIIKIDVLRMINSRFKSISIPDSILSSKTSQTPLMKHFDFFNAQENKLTH